MKKILAVIGVIGAGATANSVYAQAATDIVTPTCDLDARELAQAPKEDELLAQQASLTTQKNDLARRLEALPAGDEAGRKELENRIELNRIALTYVQKALASYAKRQDNIAECKSALNRWALVNQIISPQGSAADRQVVLDAEATSATEKLGAAKTANAELNAVGPAAAAYTKLSLGGADFNTEPRQAPSRQAGAGGTGTGSAPENRDRCDLMIEFPEADLRIGSCGSEARIRSARSFGGGAVAFPTSVLRPRGIAANLAGSSSDGMVSITYADSFRFRRTPKNRGQLPWEFGYSFGVKAKDGLIFSRDDNDTSIRDSIDGKATVSFGLFFNVYEGETLKEWDARAAKIKDAAIKACRKDQASGESKAPSTCTGQSLTDWVFFVKQDNGSLLNPEIAKQADDLYFRSKDEKPKWGAGINFDLSRSNYDYLNPADFIADPDSKNQSDGGWNYQITPFGYWRVNPSSSKWDVSLIGSVSRNWEFGYPEDTKKMQFCKAVTPATPFVTGGCSSYYPAAPKRIKSWTPAVEVRILTPRLGTFPSLGISPKVSYKDVEGSKADRWRIELPVLAFVEKEAGLGVGLQYSREEGGKSDIANADGTVNKLEREDALKIVVTKAFSLTGF